MKHVRNGRKCELHSGILTYVPWVQLWSIQQPQPGAPCAWTVTEAARGLEASEERMLSGKLTRSACSGDNNRHPITLHRLTACSERTGLSLKAESTCLDR